MPVIIIEGPEKAGKTTLISELLHALIERDIPAERIHWQGRAVPDDRVYSPLLQEHSQDLSKVWIWDRGWVSEHVYGTLLGQDRRLALDPWLGEWLHGRAVQVAGVQVILAGPPSSILERLRDDTDLDVSPAQERVAYIEYAAKFSWAMIKNRHTQRSVSESVDVILADLFSKERYSCKQWSPPNFAGPADAKVVVVGEQLGSIRHDGSWLPFTSSIGTRFGREFKEDAFKVLWTDVTTCDPQLLRNKETIIACGNITSEWCHREIKGGVYQRLISIPELPDLYNDSAWQQLQYVRQVIQSLNY